MKSLSTTHTTKFVSSCTWIKSSSIRPHWNQVNLNHTQSASQPAHTKIKWFSPRVQKNVNSSTHTTKLTSSLHWNKVMLDPPHLNQFTLDPHKNQVIFPADTKNKWFSASIQVTKKNLPPTQQPNQFQHYAGINSSWTPHTEIKSISTTITKTKSISMLSPTRSNFRPAYK